MAKIAKLVTLSLMTRVIVEDTTTEEEIIKLSKNSFILQLENELNEHIEEVVDDTEMPYEEGEEYKDKFGQRLAVGDTVTMPEATPNDMWSNTFVGQIESFLNDYAVVMDGDGDCFSVECERLFKGEY